MSAHLRLNSVFSNLYRYITRIIVMVAWIPTCPLQEPTGLKNNELLSQHAPKDTELVECSGCLRLLEFFNRTVSASDGDSGCLFWKVDGCVDGCSSLRSGEDEGRCPPKNGGVHMEGAWWLLFVVGASTQIYIYIFGNQMPGTV